MRSQCLILLLLAALATPAVSAENNVTLKPYTARYNARYKGLSGGDIEFTLQSSGNGRYVYSSHLLPNFLGSLFTSDQAEDDSEVVIDGGMVQPLQFRSEDGSRNTDKDIRYDFDWRNHQVAGHYKNADFKMTVPPGAQDRLSIQLAAMLALRSGKEPGKLVMLEKNELQEYTILRDGNIRLKVAAGEFDTVIFKSQRSGSSRSTRYWYAEKLGYIPVRAERSTDGKPDIVMELKSIKFD